MKTPKVCIVTGASSGIGYGIAEALHSEGNIVIATARRGEKLRKLGLKDENIYPGDLNDPEFVDRMVESVIKRLGRCDYLFNCAGVAVVATIEKMDIDLLCNMMRLNVESTFRITYLMLKHFKKQGFGHIVNISSILGTKVRPTAGAYASTKFAMEALSEALRMELAGTDILVSCIEPGLVMTELHKEWEVHPKDGLDMKAPLEVSDVVETVKFLMNQPSHVRIPRLMILPGEHSI